MITFFLYACLALGWNVIMGYAGQISLAQTLFIGAGVYAPALLFMYFGISPWLGMWAGVFIAVALGAFIGYLSFRYKVKGGYFALISIAFGQIGVAIVLTYKFLGGGQELVFKPITNAAIDFQFATNTPFYYIGLIILGGMILYTIHLKGSKLGYYLMAMRENEDAAQAIGVHTTKYKTYALMISAVLTAIAGTYWAQYLGMAVVREQMGLGILIVLVLCAQIGGLGTVFGPVLGALLVVMIMTGVRWYLPLFPGMNVVIYSFLLILAIVFMPRGVIALFSQGRTPKPKPALAEPGAAEEASTFLPSFLAPQRQDTSFPLLKIEGASKNFGGLMAVDNLSFEVASGEIVGLIGPNGAGKTTAFNLITGFYEPVAGEIVFDNKRLNGKRPDQTCRLGVVRTFQIVHPFSGLTTVENVMLGAFSKYNNTSEAKEKALNILRVTGMVDKAEVPAQSLTLALQRRLEIARALATEPKLILLDESMAGLTPTEMKEAIELIRKLREGGITFLVVEHVMPIIMNLAERIVVMNMGQNMAEGTPEEIANNKEVIEAYLGEEAIIA